MKKFKVANYDILFVETFLQNMFFKNSCPCTSRVSACPEGKSRDFWESNKFASHRPTGNNSCLTAAINSEGGVVKCRAQDPNTLETISEITTFYFIGFHFQIGMKAFL